MAKRRAAFNTCNRISIKYIVLRVLHVMRFCRLIGVTWTSWRCQITSNLTVFNSSFRLTGKNIEVQYLWWQFSPLPFMWLDVILYHQVYQLLKITIYARLCRWCYYFRQRRRQCDHHRWFVCLYACVRPSPWCFMSDCYTFGNTVSHSSN